MAAKEISVKKYVVRLSGEERERLETLIRKGKSPARRVLKARILLKADVSPRAAAMRSRDWDPRAAPVRSARARSCESECAAIQSAAGQWSSP